MTTLTRKRPIVLVATGEWLVKYYLGFPTGSGLEFVSRRLRGAPRLSPDADSALTDQEVVNHNEESRKLANTKSQMKRIRTNEKRRVRNQAVKSELKTYIRKTREAVEAGDQNLANQNLRIASRKLDVAVSKGVIHKNQARNRKSKLSKRVNAMA